MAEFKVLGPLVVVHDGAVVDLRSAVLRRLLAGLLCRAGQVVRAADLFETVWPERQPVTAHKTLQVYVHRLRRKIGADQVQHGPGGYQLAVPPAQVDALCFADLLVRARQARDQRRPDHAASLLRRALAHWRGEPYADVSAGPLVGDEIHRLNELRLLAYEECVAAELDLGRHAELVAELDQLTRAHPYRERLRGQHMLSLFRAGRTAEALAAFRHTREQFVEELGIEPGPALHRLHEAILRGEPAGNPAGYEPPGEPATAALPRQLPAVPAALIGRDHELKLLDELLTAGPGGDPATPGGDPATPMAAGGASTVVVTAIDGMAGIGKTALALHAAHQVAGRYPDGQLFIDLHGYTQGMEPIEPAEALDHLLRGLGVPGPQIPPSLDQRAALYRTWLADRQMLIVLDNAATETQLTPLLPAAPGCLVLVTSRRRLAGLDHTHTLSLDTLPVPDAVTLFRQTAGEGRLGGQPPGLLAELVELCGRLPLAIRIAAARLRSHPAWNLCHLVERLRDQRHRLVELEAGQRSITAALDLSYQDLSTDQQRTYRLLGLHPGPDIDRYAAAALLDSTLPEAGRMLEQLLEAHLLQEPVPGRYRFHDLIRAHAAHTGTRDEIERGGLRALGRLLDYHRHTASVAMEAAYPYERERCPKVPPVRTPAPALSDPAHALGWLDTDLSNLTAAARYATEHGRPAHVLHLSTILHRHLRTRGRYHDALTLHRQALTIARATGRTAAELLALNGLGHIHRRQGRHEQAFDHHQQALRIACAIGHRPGELDALNGLGHIHLLQSRHAQAIDHYQQALRIACAIGHRPGELDALNGLGHLHRMQGGYGRAIDHYQQALRIACAIGHRPGELDALNGLGQVHRRQGGYEQAIDHYQQALRIARATGHRPGELNALNGLGHTHRMQDQYEQATDQYQRLLDLAHEGGDRNSQFEARQGLGRLQHATGHPDAAIAHHDQALALAGELGQPDDQARAYDGLAHAHQALNQHEQARRYWQHALDILTGLGIDYTDDEETTTTAIRAHLADRSRAGRTAGT